MDNLLKADSEATCSANRASALQSTRIKNATGDCQMELKDHNFRIKWIILAAWICVFTDGGLANAQSLSIEHNGVDYDLVERGAVVAASLWRFDPLRDKRIFVCWENASQSFQFEMALVRSAVAAAWERHSELEFVGWGDCAPGSTGIRIRIEDSGPHVKYLGRALDGRMNGMALNFTFESWLPACSNGTKSDWINDIAVHEFGHAIGFTHEHNRDDTPSWCTNSPQGTDPDTYLTKWDAESEMNYCYCDGDAELSELDIKAVQALYGRP